MGKIIRPTYPVEFSVGLLLLVFVLSCFLSYQIFEIPGRDLDDIEGVYLGIFLVSSSVIMMLLILWEEILFPVQIKPTEDGLVFRNHRTKLRKQLLFYCAIPAIFVFIYFTYDVNIISFVIWATICTVTPVVGKLVSGIHNYNDFLTLANESIEYKNNEKEGAYPLTDIQQITLMYDERKILHKIQLSLTSNGQVIIDLDEMELDAFMDSIDQYIKEHYADLVTKTEA